jgi:hypothetical protein
MIQLIEREGEPNPFEAYNSGSFLGRRTDNNICKFEGDKCNANAEACHYVNADIMTRIYTEQKQNYPTSFGGVTNSHSIESNIIYS